MIKEIKTEFRKYRNVVFLVFAFFMTASFAFFAAGGMSTTSAVVSTAGFKPGNIISDAVMANYNSMSLADIQHFLTSKNPCKNTNYSYYQQLSAASPNVKWHWDNGHFVCLSEERFGDNDNEIGTGQSAAEIIYEAAQDYRINPQVLLVLLEKETSLITDPIPNDYNYRRATGYGCPDTAACSSKYYGFKNQIRNAAWLFRYTLDNGYSGYPEKTRGVRVGYHPNAACGSTEVYIENRATAALYRYTPYQPNAASLAAGYGTGDACSSYGNRNFYLYFNNWFGSTQAAVDGEMIEIPDGEYSIVPKTTNQRALGVSASKNGGNVQLAAKNDADATQRWKFTYNTSTGYYTIANAANGKVIDIAEGSTSNGTNLQIWDHAATHCQQQWKIYRTADGYYTFETACSTGIVMDVAGASTAVGANAQVWLTANNDAQKFTLSAGRTIDDGIYTIQSAVNKNYSIDLAGAANSANGTNIQVWSGNKVLAQRWLFTYHESGDYYTIVNPKANTAFDLNGGQTHYGNNIQGYAKNTTCSQQWKLVEVDNDYVIVSNCHYNKVLDLSQAKATDGNNVQIWNYNRYTLAQRWAIRPEAEIKDGNYAIQSALNATKAVDLPNNNVQNSNLLQLWQDYSRHVAQQQWYIKRNANGSYGVYHDADTSMSVDVWGGSMNNTTSIQLYSANNTCAQQWYLVDLASGYTFLSVCDGHHAIDVPGGITSDGIKLHIYEANETNAQKFKLTQL